jgi:hypothetical protein
MIVFLKRGKGKKISAYCGRGGTILGYSGEIIQVVSGPKYRLSVMLRD